MYFLVTSDRTTVLKDDDGDDFSFATSDGAITKARELSNEHSLPRIVYVFDGRPTKEKQPRVRAYAGRATWLRKCGVCRGAGVLAGLGGWSGPPSCDKCCGSGYIDDLECAR